MPADYRRPSYTPQDDLQRRSDAAFKKWIAGLPPKTRQELTASLPVEVAAIKHVNRRLARKATAADQAIKDKAREILKR